MPASSVSLDFLPTIQCHRPDAMVKAGFLNLLLKTTGKVIGEALSEITGETQHHVHCMLMKTTTSQCLHLQCAPHIQKRQQLGLAQGFSRFRPILMFLLSLPACLPPVSGPMFLVLIGAHTEDHHVSTVSLTWFCRSITPKPPQFIFNVSLVRKP